ncbi:MAG: hypothetical protein ACYC9U_06405 [Nitrososphaerales archaeon]
MHRLLTLPGTYIDTNPYPSSSIDYQQIQNEIANDMSIEGWPGGLDAEFFIYIACNSSGIICR